MNNQSFFSSWSGGKDSAFALHRAIQNGGRAARLLTMFDSEGDRSKSHAVSEAVIRAQADAMGIPLVIRRSGWMNYKEQFLSGLDEMKTAGITTGVFGDIDLEDHRKWVVDTCAERGIEALHPLWGMSRMEVVLAFLDAGFRATVVVGHDERFPSEWVGRAFDRELIKDMESRGIDPCGEAGEFHTLVTDGPVFKEPLRLRQSAVLKRDGYSFARMELAE
ncbi:hypothetical protein AV656_10840 [Bhargavaea cecembensis]|uniref:Diphthamide synthase domain-containing protein n=1 Tax=Bhargavaea cecembensis TaxID=394098 RepID=A0A161SIT6_9BACL|nr:diphthine--ammonia ligase [Bhargavaea cecembensis]KZE37073.1 hypothetical protein AV656_10840 [Bhargavaea cecembensis]